MKFTSKQHMKAAALMQSKAEMAKPENRKALLDLANAHRILARKAAERELRLASTPGSPFNTGSTMGVRGS